VEIAPQACLSFPYVFVVKPSMTCSDAGYDFRNDALAKYLAAPLRTHPQHVQ
jgi:hypothetical protein